MQLRRIEEIEDMKLDTEYLCWHDCMGWIIVKQRKDDDGEKRWYVKRRELPILAPKLMMFFYELPEGGP